MRKREKQRKNHRIHPSASYPQIYALFNPCLQRTKLKKADIHDSWASLRETMSVQRRVTASFQQRDGRTLNVRKSTLAEPDLMKIFGIL